jgi:hypothetical protein
MHTRGKGLPPFTPLVSSKNGIADATSLEFKKYKNATATIHTVKKAKVKTLMQYYRFMFVIVRFCFLPG